MTTYNGYELNYSLNKFKTMATKEMSDIKMLSPESEAYKNLSDKKVLKHLVAAARILNNVALKQDNAHNIAQKEALEKAANKGDEHASWALKIFNSFNGVSGLNGINRRPITIFKGLKTPIGKNFYPEDLSIKEFHKILLNMFAAGEIEEIKKILSARTMVIRKGKKLKAVDYT